jgi:DNA-directed RNA polymerase specialized sigma24 family protein
MKERVLAHLPQLLVRLDENPARAGLRYEELRRRLILFFRLKQPADAEQLADKVLDRVARRIAEGLDILRMEAYVLGVARFVQREHEGSLLRAALSLTELAHEHEIEMTGTPSDPAAEEHQEALGRCLEELTAADRSMILDYYAAEGARRIDLRQTMARQLGIKLNALHNRALRLRKQLEQCVARQFDRVRPR